MWEHVRPKGILKFYQEWAYSRELITLKRNGIEIKCPDMKAKKLVVKTKSLKEHYNTKVN